MEKQTIPVSFRGQVRQVPAIAIPGRHVVVSGKWVKSAIVHDEEWLPGETVERPDEVIALLKRQKPTPDLFSFSPSEPDPNLKFPFRYEWDNVAVIRTESYDAWWKGLSQDARRNVRLASKRGVVVRAAPYDDKFAAGIKGIYDETPIRQGRKFWHFGKDFDAVKRENSTYVERSEFIGAYLQDELIGFIKMVYVGRTARIMQILSMNAHFDKKPANAMIAKAVEISAQKGMAYLAYCRYVYGTKKSSSITEFKRRNGFEELRFPRYFIPLTFKGRILLKLGLHQGVRAILPEPVVERLLEWRAKFYDLFSARGKGSPATTPATAKEHAAAAAE